MSTSYRVAAQNMDWQQVALNGGPPCFHLDGDRFCSRAERWPGHKVVHRFVSLLDLLESSAKTTETVLPDAGEAKPVCPTCMGFHIGWLGNVPCPDCRPPKVCPRCQKPQDGPFHTCAKPVCPTCGGATWIYESRYDEPHAQVPCPACAKGEA